MSYFHKALYISSAALMYLFLLPCPLRCAPAVSLSLDKEIIPLNKTFVCKLVVSWEGDADLYLVAPPHLTLPEGIEEESSTFSSISKGEFYSLTYSYTLHAKKKGGYLLPPIEISYWEKGINKEEKIKTDELHFKASSLGITIPGKYLLAGTLAIILAGLFVTLIVLNKKKKRARGEVRLETAITKEMMLRELEQSNAYRIKGDWENYLQKVISIRNKLPAQDKGEHSLGNLDTLAERITYGGFRPTPEEIHLIQRQLEKALKRAFPDDKDKELDGIEFQ